MKKKQNLTDKISIILFYGVLISSIFMILGLTLLFFKDKSFNIFDNNFQIRLSNISFSAENLLSLGILLLIFTPIIRVIGMLIQYIVEKNKIYIWISITVVIILVISLLLGLNHN